MKAVAHPAEVPVRVVRDHDRALREQAFRDGMRPLRVSGAMKVAAGLTTPDEVIKVAPLA